MAIIKPFKALRPKSELVTEVASPPYDVLNREEAFEIAEHVRRAIEEHVFEEEKESFHLSVSAGVATLGENTPEEMPRAVAIFEWADKALYRAKEAGKGRTVAASDEEITQTIALEND